MIFQTSSSGLEDFTEWGHRSDDILGTFAREPLLFKSVSGAEHTDAERDDT